MEDFIPEQEWKENLTEKCGVTDFYDAFCLLDFIYAGIFVIAFGAYFGILLQSRCFKGMTRYQ